MDYFKAQSNLRPMSDNLRQARLEESFDTFPAIVEINYVNNSILFSWLNQKADKFAFKINSKVIVNNDIAKIRSKIRFPPENIPDEILAYTKETEFIDINPQIKAKANEIQMRYHQFQLFFFSCRYA